MASRLQKRVWAIVEASQAGDRLSRLFDTIILSLIFLNVAAVFLQSVPSLDAAYRGWFLAFEIFSVAVFTVEYILRLWACVAEPRFHRPILGRLRYATGLLPIVDLLAILPFYLPFVGVDLRIIRVLRLIRIVRVAKIARYYSSLQLIKHVFVAKKEELLLTTFVMVLLLVIAASGMYYCENEAQPETFSSIPASMWWAVTTLTTLGYGDVYPVTVAGKLFASVIAILGIGMFALPTGILGAGFMEQIEKRNAAKGMKGIKCPHCGRDISESE